MTNTWTSTKSNYGNWDTLTYSAQVNLTAVAYVDTGSTTTTEYVTAALHVGESDRLVFIASVTDTAAAGVQTKWDKAATLVPQFSMDGVVWAEAADSDMVVVPTFSATASDPATPKLGYSDYNAMYIRFRHDGGNHTGGTLVLSISVYKQYFGKAEGRGRR